ncbi:MAG: helix-turn-helix transcriptional regulator [Clostridiales bacterium]|nr:helix-turn-helix transcriptional regulator [Clostridiales bacterium]
MRLNIDLKKVALRQAEQKLTIKDLASMAGLSITGTRNILDGRCHPRVDTVGKIAKALNIEAFELLIHDQQGATQCQKCKHWYSMVEQKLIPPGYREN